MTSWHVGPRWSEVREDREDGNGDHREVRARPEMRAAEGERRNSEHGPELECPLSSAALSGKLSLCPFYRQGSQGLTRIMELSHTSETSVLSAVSLRAWSSLDELLTVIE